MGDYVNESTFPLSAASKGSLHRWIDIPARSQTKQRGLEGQCEASRAQCMCARACVFTCIYSSASASVCACIFYQALIQVPPDAGAICSPANQRPQQNASPLETCFIGSLPVCQYYWDTHCALPQQHQSHTKGRLSPQIKYHLAVMSNRHEILYFK